MLPTTVSDLRLAIYNPSSFATSVYFPAGVWIFNSTGEDPLKSNSFSTWVDPSVTMMFFWDSSTWMLLSAYTSIFLLWEVQEAKNIKPDSRGANIFFILRFYLKKESR